MSKPPTVLKTPGLSRARASIIPKFSREEMSWFGDDWPSTSASPEDQRPLATEYHHRNSAPSSSAEQSFASRYVLVEASKTRPRPHTQDLTRRDRNLARKRSRRHLDRKELVSPHNRRYDRTMQLAPTSEEAALEMKHLEASEQARPKSSEDHSDFGQKEASEARPGKEEGVMGKNHQQAPAPRTEGGDVRRRDTEPPEKKPSRNTASETGQPRQGRYRTEERLSQPSRRNHSAAPTGKPLSRPAPEEQAPQGRSFLSAFRVSHTRKPNAEEQANYLHEQCETLKAEKAALIAHNTALMADNEELHRLNTQLRRMVHELRVNSDMAQSEYLKERQQLKGKLDGLTNAHVQSVSSVGTGLEPISDQTFDDRFRALRDNVNEWCRKLYKHRRPIRPLHDLDDDDLKKTLTKRVQVYDELRFYQLLEVVAWSRMEWSIFGVWFPGFERDQSGHLGNIESLVIRGDRGQYREKAEFWRAYTKSLLFQNPELKARLEDVREESADLLADIDAVTTENSKTQLSYFESLQKSLVSARVLAVELGCQRGVYYEMDEDIRVGDPYDDEKMTNALHTGDEGDSQAVVSCIIAKGWVKRPYAGSADILARICKARVLVKIRTPV